MKILRVSDAFQARVERILASLEADVPAAGLIRRVPLDLVAITIAERLVTPVTDAQIRGVLTGLIDRNIVAMPAQSATSTFY